MDAFATNLPTTAQWVQPKVMVDLYELRSQGALLGSLTYRPTPDTLGLARTAGGTWAFRSHGVFSPVVVTVDDAPEALAIYRQVRSRGDGSLAFNDRRQFTWRPTGFWARAWDFAGASESALVEFRPVSKLPRPRDMIWIRAILTIGERGTNEDVLPILVTLGMCLLLRRQEQAALVRLNSL